MARFVRFALSFLFWPMVWAAVRALVDCFGLISASSGTFFSVEAIALGGGIALFLLAWVALPRPVRVYVLGHELTHAVWGMAFGARVSRLQVGESGGSVRLTKSNVWITLAPYFFPFYTIVVILIALATRGGFRLATGAWTLPCPPLWMLAVGFTWCFHVCFTLRSLAQRQPDIQEYGRIFSWTLILTMNVVGVLVWMLVTTDLSVATVFRQFSFRMVSAYAAVWALARAGLAVVWSWFA